MAKHTWQFMVSNPGDGEQMVVVCSTCGLIRTGLLPTRINERHIWLGGACSGTPQAQEPASGATKRTDIG